MPSLEDSPFARVVQRLIGERSLREAARESGISHTRISDMQFGVVPSYRLLEKFAKGLGIEGQDLRELFEAANYPPPPEVAAPACVAPSPEEALETIIESVEQLEYDPDLEGITIKGYQGAENLTPEQIELANRVVRALLTEQRRKRGVE